MLPSFPVPARLTVQTIITPLISTTTSYFYPLPIDFFPTTVLCHLPRWRPCNGLSPQIRSSYQVYIIEVSFDDGRPRQTVYRRFRDFESLHKKVRPIPPVHCNTHSKVKILPVLLIVREASNGL